MTVPAAGPKLNVKKRYTALIGIIIVVCAGWSAAWAYGRTVLSNEIDRIITGLSTEGTNVGCRERSVRGFPFRYEVSCNDLTLQNAAGQSAELGLLHAVALIYNPWHIIFEARGPMALRDELSSGKLNGAWETARASIIFNEQSIRQVDAILEKVSFEIALPFAFGRGVADQADIHLRAMPDADETLEAFVALQDLTSDLSAVTSDPLTARLHVRISDGMSLLAGKKFMDLPVGETGVRPIQVVQATLNSAGAEAIAEGQLEVGQSGLISGALDLTISDVTKTAELIGRLFPENASLPAALEGAARAMGGAGENSMNQNTVTLPLTITDNQLRMGLIPLGVLPIAF
ncbi:hypothetical protein JM93_03260 [Roseibium hamelinense]|uniref:DUF2125 domain-containing protein n=1 Tax=Roseibium hamelinense TaxID=150831 RepID=A0A562SPV3_9HYPH|nr:DUF2125 domain-containing protein [Roseibium hamelinense]MTI44046.1 DUF2125 domain-containing protein [Roseibium hamelinense]TWI82746.1 hypothetical protein JM93_03260 [Roseibium hamelinense]